MNLKHIDFNELYKEQKARTSFEPKGKDDWNKKAVNMNSKIHKSIYNEDFLSAIDLEGCETILDVGCGVGNLSLKLAPKVKKVYSMDYATSMLEYLNQNAKEQNITNIESIEGSWYDSWDDIPEADVVIASRSMEVKDMKGALEKINSKAKKRAYITYKVGGSFLDEDITTAINKDIVKKPDYIYIVNILYLMGINASVNFLRSEGRSAMYTDADSFVKSVAWSLGDLTPKEEAALIEYFNTVTPEAKERNKYVYWAMISWDK